MKPKIVFMGSPDFAVSSLHALINKYDVVGVITQPDRPFGRGRKITAPPVKLVAQEFKVPVCQPVGKIGKDTISQINSWKPDLIVVAAFGQILRDTVLQIPQHGCLNVHASLLPRWRGAAPIQAAILHGDSETGVTIMQMDAGLDTGPIISQKSIPIQQTDTAGSLSNQLSELGSNLLLRTIPGYLESSITPTEQNDSLSTYAPVIKKIDGELDFNRPADELTRKVRAYSPWPGAYMKWRGSILKIHNAISIEATDHVGSYTTGKKLIFDGYPAIASSTGLFVITSIQPAGKKPMNGLDFVRGAQWID